MSGRPRAADVICIAQRIEMKPGKTERRPEVNEPMQRSHCSETDFHHMGPKHKHAHKRRAILLKAPFVYL